MTFPRRHREPLGLLEPSVTRMRVRPGDIDLYWHVNNGVCLQMMDIARANYIADIDGFGPLRRRGWFPVVAASTMSYRRSLRLGDRFEITTRTLGWDERVVYVEQIFTRGEEVCARGFVAARFLARAGHARVPATDVVELLGAPGQISPDLPHDMLAWARAVDVAQRVAPACG